MGKCERSNTGCYLPPILKSGTYQMYIWHKTMFQEHVLEFGHVELVAYHVADQPTVLPSILTTELRD